MLALLAWEALLSLPNGRRLVSPIELWRHSRGQYSFFLEAVFLVRPWVITPAHSPHTLETFYVSITILNHIDAFLSVEMLRFVSISILLIMGFLKFYIFKQWL